MVSFRDNPFNTLVFRETFISHFVEGKQIYTSEFIKGLGFFKHPRFPYLINLGRNLTKGISYDLEFDKTQISRDKKVYLIYDVPEYFEVKTNSLPDHIGLHKIKQYPGYYIDLALFKDYQTYFQKSFSHNRRYKYRKYLKRLENSFDIRYEMFCGPMDREKFFDTFSSFKTLLEKRFSDKKIRNNNLDPEEWSFYTDIAFKMIHEKKAGLFVIFQGSDPISITLNFLGGGIYFNAITVFDIDYGNFRVGTLSILKQLEWCFENKIRKFDFSKGHYDYKQDFSTHSYPFEYHVYYNRKSVKSRLIGGFLKRFLSLKQWLREKNVNEFYNRFLFKVRNSEKDTDSGPEYRITTESRPEKGQFRLIEKEDLEYASLKPYLHSFLFISQERLKDVSIYKEVKSERIFFEGNVQAQCLIKKTD